MARVARRVYAGALARKRRGAKVTQGPSNPPSVGSADEVRQMLGVGLKVHRQGDLASAELIYREVLQRDPAQPDALHFLGMIAFQRGRFAEAAEAISSAIALNPRMPEMRLNRGLALAGLGKFDDALADHEAALVLRPELAQAHQYRADALQALGRAPEALAAYDRALALQPMLATAYASRGDVLQALGRYEDALGAYGNAIALSPKTALTYFNRGNAMRQLRRFEAAAASYASAIALQPDMAVAHHNRGVCLLTLGDLDAGFREYEWRKRAPDAESGRTYAQPAWTGLEDLQDRSLFVYPELFLGDVIQFCRYAKLAEARGARVTLAAPAALHALLRTLSPTLELVDRDAAPAQFDYHCALMSLPLAFRTELATIPAEVPYLSAEPARVERWRDRIGTQGFRVGVCWQGSTAPYSMPMQRSFPLRLLQGVARLPGVRLISLQKHDGLDQLDGLPPGMVAETLGETFDAGPDAFVDTAAVIACCDLVISADTAVAHVAGALAAPTWIPLPFVPDWRWLTERPDSPWYPSVRLFRQAAQGDWSAPIGEIETALAARLAETSDA